MRWLALALVALRLEDVPASLRSMLPEDFEAYIRDVDRSSAQRLLDGEMDHMVHYLLQSRRFTDRAPIEPAVSARAHHERKSVPAGVDARLVDFLRASPADERFRYLRGLVHSRQEVIAEYERAMRFLYQKEFDSRSRQGEERRQFVAGLYQKRGHSSDTSLDVNFGVYTGLKITHELRPKWKVQRALVIGPGLDFAPRTSFKEEASPESHQPFVLADALLRLKLASLGTLSLQCIDLNPRVVDYFQGRPSRLTFNWQAEDNEQRAFLQSLGSEIGTRSGDALQMRPDIVERVRATTLNVLTSRLEEKFDLIVATNILLYFDSRELILALVNIKAMLKPGGIFLHNDMRGEMERYGRELGMPVVHARMIRLSSRRELYDSVVVHEGDNAR